MRQALPVIAAAGLALLLAGGPVACRTGITAPPATTGNDIITVASGTQCGHTATGASAVWLDTEDALRTAYGHMTRHSIGADIPPVPTPDFTVYGVLQVFMGQQSTGGYRLRLLSPHVEHLPATALIRLEWLSPPPGTLTTQVITSPCLLLAVPRGDYRTLTVADQSGHTRAVAEL